MALALLLIWYAAPSPVAAQARRVVVLGSSTAAGAGPAWPDSAWVPRYRAYATGIDPGHEIVNLAVGGYTTYHVLPTGQVPPAGRPMPDPAHNITAALALQADAIVVNLPSNDAAFGYSVAEQLANYDTLLSVAVGIPVWITTSQPRNLNEAGRANLRAMRDSIETRYAPRALDFWTTLAQPDGTIEPLYDSGDGIHLNSPAHRILFERVAAARILGETPTSGAESPERAEPLTVRAWPSPFRHATTIGFSLTAPAHTRATVHDLLGRLVAELVDSQMPAGAHEIVFAPAGAPASTYHVRIESGRRFGSLVIVARR